MTFWMDLRHALRLLHRSPAATAIIVLTLALCIGANTAIFSVVDAALLRPLPYPEPDRLVRVVTHYRGRGAENDSVGQDGRTWELVRDHATYLDSAVYGGTSGVNFAAEGNVQYVKQQRVSSGFFRVLGVQPLIGREFTPTEDRSGGPPVAILSYSLWRRVFRQDPAVVGKTLMLRGEPYTVVGIMPENFRSNATVDLWTPLRPSTTGEGGGINYALIGRLKDGVTWAQADAQIEAVGVPRIQAMKLPEGVHVRLRLMSLQEGQTQDVRKPLLIVWAAVGLVLLIGCANVTSLLLARGATRSREMATRMALGSGRRAIVMQLLVETLVLAILGGAAGLLAGYAGLAGLKVLAVSRFGIVQTAHLDVRVLAATAGLSILVSLLVGIFPAFEAGAVDLRNALSEAGGRGVAGVRKRWPRKLLVAGEVALAVMLLIGAGLLIRTLARFYHLTPGFDPAHIVTASFSLQDKRYSEGQRVNQLFETGLARIRALPGVEAAGAGLTLPFERGLNVGFQRADGPGAGPAFLITNSCYVTPGYFEALRIPLMRGRAIRDGDSANSASVVVVNEAFVKRYFARQSPLGSHLAFGNETREVVGVVGDVEQGAGFGNFGPLGAVPGVYIPVAQTDADFLKMVHAWYQPDWIIRAAGSPSTVIRAVQEIATSIDPLLPISEFRSMDDVRSGTLSFERFQATLLGTLAGLAFLLAVVGIYGLMAQSVAERSRELGIRMALGATLAQAIREATLPGVMLAVAGVAAGCVLAGLSSRVLKHLMWGVSTTDAATYAGVAGALLLVASIASLAPALRIARLNPADTLREE